MKIIIAILIFSVIVLFHELGHFLLAKKNGVRVVEFSLGMGPRICSVQKGETKYSVKIFPLGGSCMMQGEDEEDEDEHSFNKATIWGRISIIAAGPIFNFILAYILSAVIVGCVGYEPADVLEVQEGSPAAEAGLQKDDKILAYQGHKISLGKDIYLYQMLEPLESGDTITMTVQRGKEKYDLTYKPEDYVRYLLGMTFIDDSMKIGEVSEGMPAVDSGIKAGDTLTSIDGNIFTARADYVKYIAEHPLTEKEVQVTYERDGLAYEAMIKPQRYAVPITGFSYNIGCEKTKGLQIFKYAAVEVKYYVQSTILGLKGLLTGGFGVQDLSGPIGIVDVIGETYEESKSQGAMMIWMNMLNMAVLLSANLGVMNLLPIPALDGGRLVFLVIELIRRKPVNREAEGMVHFAGFVLLMLLMVFVMYQDIIRIF